MELGRPSVLEWRSPVVDAWVEVRVYPTPAGLTAYFHDISERKRTEEALRQSEEAARQAEERYRELFDTMIEGFCVIEWSSTQRADRSTIASSRSTRSSKSAPACTTRRAS